MSSHQLEQPAPQSAAGDLSVYSQRIQPTSQYPVAGFSMFSQQLMRHIKESPVTVGHLDMLSEQLIQPTSQLCS